MLSSFVSLDSHDLRDYSVFYRLNILISTLCNNKNTSAVALTKLQRPAGYRLDASLTKPRV